MVGADVVLDSLGAGRLEKLGLGYAELSAQAPGLVLTSLKWMLRPDSPLYIRPSLDPSFLSFVFGMWRASNAKAQRAGFAGHLALAEHTVEVFDEYRADGIDFKLKTPASGILQPGSQVQVRFDPAQLHLFDPATGLSLRQTVPAAEAEAPDDIAAQ